MAAKKRTYKPVLGTIFTIGSPQVAEIISQSGFDWVLIDMEHSTLSLDSAQTAIQVMGEKILKIVRAPGNDEIWIKRVLDTGCDGILVPMIKNAEEAGKVVIRSKYPVEGQRSVGLTRAHKYGAGFTEYVSRANKDLIIMIQIEHIEGVKNIDSILKVKGIDSIFIGPYDLSASMGLMGQVHHPDVRSAIDLIKRKCRKAGLPYGIFGMDPVTLSNELKDGCTFLLCGVDSAILTRSYIDILKVLNRER
jgi:2-keto-3-deoxy-L-rhamnonate aldolase RhmA